MAEAEITLTLTWENDEAFQLAYKKDNDDAIVIVRMEENGDLVNLFDNVSAICNTFFAKCMNTVSAEMKVE